MKRIGNLYHQICSLDNLRLAESKARKGKKKQYGVRLFARNYEANLLAIHQSLVNKTYRTSEYKIKTIVEKKERIVYKLPYIDRVVHHGIMNPLEQMFVSVFTTDTYSCIKKRGIHKAHRAVKRALLDQPGTQYYLKLDIHKFYPSVDHDILKALLRRKIKDKDLLWLLDGIIDSAPGLPIGNYLSQYLANFYLAYFDHWVKEVKQVKYYFRYADDIVVLHSDKAYLHQLLRDFGHYLSKELKVQVKGNWRVSPVSCGLDFVGYVYRHGYIRLRPYIKRNFMRKLSKRISMESYGSYMGWLQWCNSAHLIKTINQKLTA
jgi:RNA-directed DNA polymerase